MRSHLLIEYFDTGLVWIGIGGSQAAQRSEQWCSSR